MIFHARKLLDPSLLVCIIVNLQSAWLSGKTCTYLTEKVRIKSLQQNHPRSPNLNKNVFLVHSKITVTRQC